MGHGPVLLLPPSRTKAAWDGGEGAPFSPFPRFSRFPVFPVFPVFFSWTAAFFPLTNRPV